MHSYQLQNPQSITSGFLIVKTYPKLYYEYVARYNINFDIYAIPRIDKTPEQYTIQYRGLDRDALDDYKDSNILAEIRLWELRDKSIDGFVFKYEDAQDVYDYLDNKLDYEIIWARIAGYPELPPNGFKSIGFEPTYFTGDHFAPQCDCMPIPRWHGTDEKNGTLFTDYFLKLNKCGLFPSMKEVQLFVDYYLSFDWTEHDDYEIAEVFIR